MHNTSSYSYRTQTFHSLAQVFNLHLGLGHGKVLLLWCKEYFGDVMFLFRLSSCLSFFLLLLHVASVILTKLFTVLYNKSLSIGDVEFNTYDHDEYKFQANMAIANEIFLQKEDLVADILGGETLLFLYKESTRNNDDGGTLLLDNETDKIEDSKEEVCLEEEDSTTVEESTYCSPLEDLAHDQMLGIESNNHVSKTNVESKEFTLEEEEKLIEYNVLHKIDKEKDFPEDERVVSIKSFHPHGEQFRIEEFHEDIENCGGSLTEGSTSNSSLEWRSSTIFRDSETEYPFTSSSRRSSSRWESYTVFPKYNEGMVFLDRISAQKLSETESLRSIKVQPRSISERIVQKLSTNKPRNQSTMGRRRGPYEELESAYVAQICLAWEALNCNYTNFRQKKYSANSENLAGSGCPDQIAQEFQQFQVLLQRFIENEPYEYGRRPEVYARKRISSTKLLHVPEFRDSEGEEGKEGMSSRIPTAEFLAILEDAIRTFMNFLKADKQKCGDIIRSFMKKRAPTVDPIFLRFLKKANKRKKMRLKEIGRRHRCIRKRKLTPQEEMEILMAIIDLKVVSRVLRMADISEEQLHWCEEKMSRVRIWDGKMQRDSSPLFFPVQ